MNAFIKETLTKQIKSFRNEIHQLNIHMCLDNMEETKQQIKELESDIKEVEQIISENKNVCPHCGGEL